MNKHDRTLAAVFSTPAPANVRWRDIESMIRAKGGSIKEGKGSRVRIEINELRATFHRPHPSPDTDKGAVEDLRAFLGKAGVTP